LASSYAHLSFDQYMQDQVFTVDAGRDGNQKYSLLTMVDRGDYSILEAMEANDRISQLPKERRASEWKRFMANHPGDNIRIILGRARDGASVLRLKDAKGRDRIVLQVTSDGTPKLQLLDSEGKPISELPQK
jgi:hypothetical protein